MHLMECFASRWCVLVLFCAVADFVFVSRAAVRALCGLAVLLGSHVFLYVRLLPAGSLFNTGQAQHGLVQCQDFAGLGVFVRVIFSAVFSGTHTPPLVLVECRLSLLQICVLARPFQREWGKSSQGFALCWFGASRVTGGSFE